MISSFLSQCRAIKLTHLLSNWMHRDICWKRKLSECRHFWLACTLVIATVGLFIEEDPRPPAFPSPRQPLYGALYLCPVCVRGWVASRPPNSSPFFFRAQQGLLGCIGSLLLISLLFSLMLLTSSSIIFFFFIFLSVRLLRGCRVIIIAISVHLNIVNTQGVYK